MTKPAHSPEPDFNDPGFFVPSKVRLGEKVLAQLAILLKAFGDCSASMTQKLVKGCRRVWNRSK